MTVPTERITHELFEEWASGLASVHATPALLLGIGHDERDGELHVLVPEDADVLKIIRMLQLALKQLASNVSLNAESSGLEEPPPEEQSTYA